MKERLDVLVHKQGFADSREKAKTLIMAGDVFVNGQREDKPGSTFDEEKSTITVKEATLKYVSRGGLKLEKALKVFPIGLEGAVCMDIGASTGGFTDCMLMNGAVKVYSVDVGYGQLDYKTISLNGKKASLGDGSAAGTYIKVTLTQALKEGDVISMTAFRNKGDESKKSTAWLVFSDKVTGEIGKSPEFPDINGGGDPETITLTVTKEMAGFLRKISSHIEGVHHKYFFF